MQTMHPEEPGNSTTSANGMPAANDSDWATRPSWQAAAPVAQSSVQSPTDRAASPAAPDMQIGRGADAATVLIVDDSRTIRHLYTFVLQSSGYTVLAAVDGVEGFEMALSATPSLLLVDMLMPRMDGLDMLRALRARERELGRAQIPALLLTALPTPPEVEPELGVLAVLDKGRLTPTDMAEHVRGYLAARAHA